MRRSCANADCEIALADDAQIEGVQREAERHDCTRRRLEQLLADLGETIE